MERSHVPLLASLFLAFAWVGLAGQCLAQDQSNRRESSSQGTSQADSRANQNQQRSTSDEDDEVEYRGLEHAALGVMLGERSGRGVRIRDVLRGSPAERAGLRSGDTIVRIDERPMSSYSEVIRYINRVEPGQNGRITVNREGDEKTLRIQFASRQELYGEDQQTSPRDWQQQGNYDQRTIGRGENASQDQDGRRDNWQNQRSEQNYDRFDRGRSEFSQDRLQLGQRNWQGQAARPDAYQRGDFQQGNSSNQYAIQQRDWAPQQQRGTSSFQQGYSDQPVLGIDVTDQ